MDTNGHNSGSTGEMQVEDAENEEDMREIEVQNVTRAGCEKANTGQFELLRVLGQVRNFELKEKNIKSFDIYPGIFRESVFSP